MLTFLFLILFSKYSKAGIVPIVGRVEKNGVSVSTSFALVFHVLIVFLEVVLI